MKRTLFGCLLALTLSSPVSARTVEDRLISGLKSQGYVVLENGFTWLGRLRIVAESARYHREIVVNPETGEVLRDYVVLLPTGPAHVPAHETSSEDDGGATVASSAADDTGGPANEQDQTMVHTGAALVGAATDLPGSADDLLLSEPVIPAETGAP